MENRTRAGFKELAALIPDFDAHMSRHFPARTEGVNGLRSQILDACIQSSALKPGLFSLSVPTGSGKALASIAFALHHAKQWQKRRVIYVIPYTSIVEQTADVFRGIFGDAVVEHHSNIDSDDPARDSVKRRLSAENSTRPQVRQVLLMAMASMSPARERGLLGLAAAFTRRILCRLWA